MKNLLFLILTIFSFKCIAQSSIKEVDDLALETKSKKNSPSKIETYSKIVRGYQNFDLKKAKEYNDSVYILSRKLNYTKGFGLYFQNKSYLMLVNGKHVKAIPIVKYAIQINKKVKDTSGYLYSIWILANCYGGIEDPIAAEREITIALDYIKNTGNRYALNQSELYQMLSLFNSDRNNYKAIWYLNKAINFEKKDGSNTYNLSNCYFTMARLYIEMKQYQKAYYYFKLVKEEDYKYPEYVYAIYQFELSRIYLGLNNFEKALSSNNKSIMIFRKTKRSPKITGCLVQFSNIYFQKKDYLKSIYYAKKVLDNEPLKDEVFDAEQLLGKCYFLQGNYVEAKKHQNRALEYYKNDYAISIYDDLSKTEYKLKNYEKAYDYNLIYTQAKIKQLEDDKSKNVGELKSEFELNEREAKLKKLNLLRIHQKQEIENREMMLKIISVSLIIVLLFLGLSVYLFNSNRRKNKLLSINNLLIEKKNEVLKKSEEKLSILLNQKEVLLKEVHHRVKNNLQLVMSLLYLQSRKSKSEVVDEFVKKSGNRINAISLIHQNLYKSNDIEKISFHGYVEELIQNIKNSLDSDFESQVFTRVNVCEVYFDFDILIPLGLIINEVVTNSFKYAFPNNQQGEVVVVLKVLNTNEYQLELSDNGVGFDGLLDDAKTLGLRLVRQLVAQVNGELRIDKNNGVHYIIKFNSNQND